MGKNDDVRYIVPFRCDGTGDPAVDGEHVMVVASSRNHKVVKEHLEMMRKAHENSVDGSTMEIHYDQVVKFQNAEQVDALVAKMKSENPHQIFADESSPENPNAVIFPKLGPQNARVQEQTFDPNVAEAERDLRVNEPQSATVFEKAKSADLPPSSNE